MSSSSTSQPTLGSRGSVPRADHARETAVLDDLEAVLMAATSGFAVAAPMLPGFTLCVAALGFLAVVLIVPVLAVAALVTLAMAILATPYLLLRSLRSIASRRPAPAPEPVPVRSVARTTPPERRPVVT